MTNDREIVLGVSAIKYIKKCLDNGRSLSHYILDIIDLDAGRVTVKLPENAIFERVEEYKRSILPIVPKTEWQTKVGENGLKSIWVPVHPFNLYVIDIIRSFLISDEGRLCMIEDPIARPTDPKLFDSKSHIEIYKDEVYHIISEGERSSGEIEDTLIAVNVGWPPLTGILTSLPTGEDTPFNKRKIDLAMLKVLSERAEKIFVKAYDGEAYLIWHRFKEIPLPKSKQGVQ